MPLLLGKDESADLSCQGDFRPELPAPALPPSPHLLKRRNPTSWMDANIFQTNGSLYMGNRMCHQGSGPGEWGRYKKYHFKILSPLFARSSKLSLPGQLRASPPVLQRLKC